MDYSTLKLVHQSAVAISLAGFVARGAGIWAGAAWVRARMAKTLPHVVDTVLIGSAIWLAVILGVSPANAPWITAKIAGLFAYIALAMVAFRFGRTPAIRGGAFALALVTFAYIVSVAITKEPRGFLVWLG
jgi:uncharacterized membrane protein SirB2